VDEPGGEQRWKVNRAANRVAASSGLNDAEQVGDRTDAQER
jgi:hypothetical protein